MNPLTPLVAWKSQQGMRGTENDDHHGWFAIERADLPYPIYVALVADGVTSTEGGAQASRIAVEAVRAALEERPDPHETLSEWLASAILHANEEILFEAKRNPQWKGMSTTLVLTALAGEKLYVMHLGDSRAYLLRNWHLYPLTTDHTWAQAAFDAGTISAQEAEHHPGRNQLQRYLGAQHGVNLARGVIAPGSQQMEEYLHICPGDLLLLCTDGIYKRLAPETMQQIVMEQRGDPQAAVDALVAASEASGEIDDMTALVAVLPSGKQGALDAGLSHTPAAFLLQEDPSHTNKPAPFTLLLLSMVSLLTLLTLYLLLISRSV